MKTTIVCLFFIVLCLMGLNSLAQGTYNLSGKVVNEKGELQKGATVFISGSQKITATDNDGRFAFANMAPGTYQVSVKMLGFSPFSQNVLLQTESVDVKIALSVKVTVLKEVVIGPDNWDQHYEMFKNSFLGTTKNAKSCEIKNPKILSFTYSKRKDLLTADADDFLIIENKRLGYRVRYLLKLFTKNRSVINYDGETSFEEMEGTEKMKKEWEENRAEAYHGSLMHFLRSVYKNTTLQDGFLARQMYSAYGSRSGAVAHIDPRPMNFDTVAFRIDSALTAMKFSSMYITYNPKKAARVLANGVNLKNDELLITDEDSILKLYLNMAVIDGRGGYSDYRTFLKQGLWSKRLVGDQLPFEYQPPANTSN